MGGLILFFSNNIRGTSLIHVYYTLGLGSDQYHNSILNSHLKYLKEVEGEAQKAMEEVSLEAPLSMA